METSYIEPYEDLNKIIKPVLELINEGDYLVISETPIAISQGRIIDESEYKPSIAAKFLASIWSKRIWGYLIGPALGIKKRTIENLRKLPKEAQAHKEVVLKHYGWKHALKPASEAGIDLTNAPGTYVSMIPENPSAVAKELANIIKQTIGKTVIVLIIDTDATYKRKNKYFTGLPTAISPIKSNMGVFGYFLGQIYENAGSTPLGCSEEIDIEKALEVTNTSESYQKSLATNLATIHSVKKVINNNKDKDNNNNNNNSNSNSNYNSNKSKNNNKNTANNKDNNNAENKHIQDKFKENKNTNTNDFSGITIEELNSITHTPAVILRSKM
ncbi:MAG: coenzyme F420-0:L-glutamate ligase [Methanobacteriaceae archaeon]